MIVENGRKYILSDGFDTTDVVGFFYGNITAEANTTNSYDIVRSDDSFFFNNNQCYLNTNATGYNLYLVEGTGYTVTKSTDGLSFTIVATLDPATLGNVHKINTFGLIVQKGQNKILFSRVTFPDYVIKPSCEVEMTYYLYF